MVHYTLKGLRGGDDLNEGAGIMSYKILQRCIYVYHFWNIFGKIQKQNAKSEYLEILNQIQKDSKNDIYLLKTANVKKLEIIVVYD